MTNGRARTGHYGTGTGDGSSEPARARSNRNPRTEVSPHKEGGPHPRQDG